MTPDLIYDQMIGAGCAKKLIFSWGGNPGVAIPVWVRCKVRLPGGGAPEMATCTGEIFITLKHSRRSFVEAVDFVTTAGFGADGTARGGVSNIGAGPTRVIIDLLIFSELESCSPIPPARN